MLGAGYSVRNKPSFKKLGVSRGDEERDHQNPREGHGIDTWVPGKVPWGVWAQKN